MNGVGFRGARRISSTTNSVSVPSPKRHAAKSNGPMYCMACLDTTQVMVHTSVVTMMAMMGALEVSLLDMFCKAKIGWPKALQL